jgi:hypothetical protein
MTKSKIVQAGIAVLILFSMVACKRSGPPPDNVKVEAPAPQVQAPPADDKSPTYVKDLRKDMQKARDVGAVEQKSADEQQKAADAETK